MLNDEKGEWLGYISEPCPNCGRFRVEHWSCGKDICEKCGWCIQDDDYFIYEHEPHYMEDYGLWEGDKQ